MKKLSLACVSSSFTLNSLECSNNCYTSLKSGMIIAEEIRRVYKITLTAKIYQGA